jgi:hypothetical protein
MRKLKVGVGFKIKPSMLLYISMLLFLCHFYTVKNANCFSIIWRLFFHVTHEMLFELDIDWTTAERV